MPKERFHLLLADRFIKSSKCPAPLAGALERERLVYFTGAHSPDIFFYDVPTFSLNTLGDRLHAFMELEGLSPLESWLSSLGRDIPEPALAWGLGFASHFLADALWHPVINNLAGNLDFCRGHGLSAIGCHRLIESEMEAFWLPRPGNADSYLGFLEKISKERDRLGEISSFYRQFLDSAGLGPLPSAQRIRRCFLKQNFLLRLFAWPVLGGFRDRLLKVRPGRYLGSLAVPLQSVLQSELSRVPANRDPFSESFMEEGFTSLASRLGDFAERLSPFPPS